uniref:WIT1/2 N-terminal helical bundle domain-containing protein n=3 Tax=Kalanchoe fedtschenkoi TaxID=63787 RepID=A0A7N0TTN1_KALFE
MTARSGRTNYLKMDVDDAVEVNSVDPEAGSSAIQSMEELSSSGEIMREVGGVAMILTKVEMDIVCSSEKLFNLNVLLMNVATRESELEVSVSVKEDIPPEKVLEFNLLCGILDSEVKELSNFFSWLHQEIVSVREIISSTSSEHMEEAFKLFEDKLQDCDESLKQSQEQLEDMKMQAADLQKTSFVFWSYEQCNYAQNAQILGTDQYIEDKVHMQTGEQKRHVLRMLEKSLARELDLDMKLNEARQIEKDLKLRLHSSNQEASYLEEEATDIWAQFLEAENTAVVLMGISKDLLGQLQTFQFNLNCLTQNRDDLKSNLEDLRMQLEGKSAEEINVLNSEVARLKENIEDYEAKLSAAKCRAETVEAKCNDLEETNLKFNEERNHLKESSIIEKEYMETQLKDLDLKLQHSLATAEASQENENMLNSTIRDMANVIKDLKTKALNAECHANGAEAKCLVLSESNAELSKEVGFLRNRQEILEASIRETNETKTESAKNIEMRAKVITSLVMQLATERDRLHQQLHSLAKENKVLVVRLQTENKGQFNAVDTSKQNRRGYSPSTRESNSASKDQDSVEETIKLASMSSEICDGTSASAWESEAGSARGAVELETVRRIDAAMLNIKHFIVALVVVVISAVACSFLNLESPL